MNSVTFMSSKALDFKVFFTWEVFDYDAHVSCKARDSVKSFDFEERNSVSCISCEARDSLTLLVSEARYFVITSCEACDSVFAFEERDFVTHMTFEERVLVTSFPCGAP